ncbi:MULTISPECIES: DUF3408 domain-containing protein [Myroides]|uniref:Conjugal transfer protein TraB n=1 Tax=Myroides odoratimimus TaxID=76832 RepID=A0AAI8G594_9FLAO|nr:DUF3408 domain-containing protein [Myroides odoratimimus]ALU26611.1 conjugal transfer protein TraB [Myroides odoratimimus]MDM1039785.1 DUF3408 domain-containing protein [Myroides odoratimimus]MDM1054032.1 DUF3408 domain-containing protein [Myroides odoratimimus]MDM1086800.1 DUF3408 domain-containing protein [Myroides odoratimimus]
MKEQNTSKKGTQNELLDEDYLMNIMSGDIEVKSAKQVKPIVEEKEEPVTQKQVPQTKEKKTKKEVAITKYQELFLINDFPSTRAGKVVYIRPEYHEVLLRITQLAKEEKTTLYSYLDNILKQHLQDYSQEITQYFNDKFKPIL